MKYGSRGSRFTYVHSMSSHSEPRHVLAIKTGPNKKLDIGLNLYYSYYTYFMPLFNQLKLPNLVWKSKLV